jgi:DNA invertase Pin-like site-specific DNA recombinase
MIGADKFDVLILYRSDLLAERVVLQLIIESVLEQVGVEVDYVQKDIDNSPEARLSRYVFAAFADYEQTKSALRDQLGAD